MFAVLLSCSHLQRAKDITGNMRPLSEFKGKVLLIVNVASKVSRIYECSASVCPASVFYNLSCGHLVILTKCEASALSFQCSHTPFFKKHCASLSHPQCGYTDSNYRGLVATYEKYKDYGLEILAFPCDAFNHQGVSLSSQCQPVY